MTATETMSMFAAPIIVVAQLATALILGGTGLLLTLMLAKGKLNDNERF